MTRWTVDAPTTLEFDDVMALHVRLIAGTVAVLASDDKRSSPGGTTASQHGGHLPPIPPGRPRPGKEASAPGRAALAVSELSGRPLQVSIEDGVLTVSYEQLSWDGLLQFLKPRKDSAAVTLTVPAECPIQLGVLSASAIVSGLRSGASIKGMSGDITLDGVTGDVEAETMSGELAACDVDGAVHLKSMSGGLTLAGGVLDSLDATTMSGQVTADVRLNTAGGIHVSTMSGDVTLRLPADSDAEVRLQSTSGPVRTEFDSLRAFKAPASHTVRGNVGAGTGHVSVTTMSGAVTLLRRAVATRGDDPPYPPRVGPMGKQKLYRTDRHPMGTL
jgi:putative adhesin